MNKNLLCISFPKKRLPSFSFLVIASFLAPLYASAQPATLEMYAGAGNPTGNGITTANQVITLQKNTDNPTGNTIAAYSPLITVTYSLSNQQFANIEGNAGVAGTQFGGNIQSGGNGFNSPVPGAVIFSLMNGLSGSVNTNYTACNPCGAGTGVDVTTNRSVSITNYSDALISSAGVQNYPLNARVQFSDITITFSQPVSNPVIHFTGLGGQVSYSTGGTINYTLGFTTDIDLVTPGLTFTKLSGSTYFDVTPGAISNSATNVGASTPGAPVAGITRYAASGTVRVNGTNIQSFTIRTFLRGDGGKITNNSGGIVAATNGNIIRWALHDNFIPGGTTGILEGVSGDGYLIGVSLPAPVAVSGNVFNDINGGNVNNSTGGANVVPSGMFANLLDASGNVVAVATVNTDGTYSFPSVFEGNYSVRLTTAAGTVGSPAPAASVPSGWVNTGEFNGTPNTGNDGTVNGQSATFTVTTNNVTNINFGIEQPPTPGTFTAASQVNPGSTTNVTVAASSFSGTDLSNGTISSLRITAFPSNATSITINGTTYTSGTFPVGGVTVPTNAAGQPTQAISVDPIDGAVTVSIPYKVTDNAGVESTVTGAVNLPFTTISLSGNVYNDIGGLVADANVNGTGIGLPSGTQLYATLIEVGVNVAAVVPVNADGTYSFPNVKSNTNYIVRVSTTPGVVGSGIGPAVTLPPNWVNTGQDCCDNTGSDGAPNDGDVSVTTGTTNVINANFGIEQLPNSGFNTQPTQNNPGGNNNATVPAVAFSGTDPDGGTVTSIRITAFPTPGNTNSITINGTTYTSGTWPAGGVTIPAPGGVPSWPILIDPLNGDRIVTINYVAIDNAGKEDPTPGNVVMPFANNEWQLSGNVFNDIGGLVVDANVNGTGIGQPGGTQVYAYLYDQANPTVILDRAVVNADGTFTFTQIPNGTYGATISTTNVVVGGTVPAVALPANWVLTGEDCCDNTGNDGTPNGIITGITVAGADLSNINFGIEQLPNSGTNTQPAQINPGGTTSVAVPATAFSGTDPDSGTPTSIRITAFPTNATSITINGTTYTSGTFPVGGVTVPTNASGQPTQAISVDPVVGNVNVVIPYAAIDNAGKEDPTPGSVTLPFFTVNLSGNVFNDVGGLLADGTVNGTGIGLPSGTQLYANLLDATGTTVIATVPVNNDGTYNFNGIAGNTNYVVQLSTNQGTVGNPAPATALPANWTNTGENLGAGAGNDGTVNGLLPVSVLAVDVANANFGIEQLPSSGTNTQPIQANPPGTANVTVPPTAFSATDPDAGTVTSIRITSFPTNATSITINGTNYTSATFPVGGVVVPTNTSGQPAQAITVDPVDGLVSVVIPYAAIDNAGKEDPTPGSVTLPFSNLSISGNVFNDANGLTNGNVDGTGIGAASGSQLYANLLDATGTTVVASVPVNPDGTYSFYGVTPNTNYTVQLSTNQGTPGSPAPVKALPAGWVNTGEDCCDNIGSDGTVNGLVNVSVLNTDVINANFGIDRQPDGTNITATPQLNPGGVIQVPVPPLVGSDPEDGTLGSGSTVRIDVLPTNATLYYNGVAVTAGQVITNYNPALLTIDPDPNTAAQPALLATFQYSFADAAGVFDPVPNTVNMQFLQPVAITGTVFDDVDGSANNTFVNIQTGTEAGTNASSQLYAYLYDNITGQVTRKVPVAADGTYGFDGLSPIGNVTIYITSDNSVSVGSATPPASTLPAGWVNTSPIVRNVPYNNPPGFLIQNMDFGIELLPESFNSTQPSQPNPGGTTSVPVDPSAFYAEDVAIGTVSSIRITSFPVNATSITINGTTYTAGTFPVGGVIIPTNANGQPTQAISVDPVDGTTEVTINYVAIDNANREDPTPASVVLPFTSTLPVRGITISGVLKNGIVTINWNTREELNVTRFEVERSADGLNFAPVKSSNSKGNGSYAYSADDNLSGINGRAVFYRIKAVDMDGNYSYSGVIKIGLDHLDIVTVNPNPFTSYVNLQVSAQVSTTGMIRIYNAEGKQVYARQTELMAGLNSIEINGLDRLAEGVYVIEMNFNGQKKTEKLIKGNK